MALATDILTALADLAPRAITPAERWASARPGELSTGNYHMLYIMVLGLLAAVAAIIVALIVRRWLVGRRQLQQEFQKQCERSGLGEEEINLLSFAAKLGQLRAPVNIVANEEVFHRCMQLLIRCERVTAMSNADKDRILTVINSAHIKLGFDDDSTLASDRRIPDGATITLMGPGLAKPVQATVTATSGWELRAQQAVTSNSLPVGTPLRAKYSRTGAIWEFQTSLIYAEGRSLTLAHPEQDRFLNRRRFRRARVDRPALIAKYPFVMPIAMSEPKFHTARLVELGAAGLVLDVEDMPVLDDKMKILVVADLRPGRTINSVGLVLRHERITSRLARLVIELTNLTEAEISELVSETNLAEHQDQIDQPHAAAEPAGAPAQPAWRQ